MGWEDLRVVGTCVSSTLMDMWDTVRQRRREGHCRWKEWHERPGSALRTAGIVLDWHVERHSEEDEAERAGGALRKEP